MAAPENRPAKSHSWPMSLHCHTLIWFFWFGSEGISSVWGCRVRLPNLLQRLDQGTGRHKAATATVHEILKFRFLQQEQTNNRNIWTYAAYCICFAFRVTLSHIQLHYLALHYTTLHYTTLHYTHSLHPLNYTIHHYITSHHIALRLTTLHCIVICVIMCIYILKCVYVYMYIYIYVYVYVYIYIGVCGPPPQTWRRRLMVYHIFLLKRYSSSQPLWNFGPRLGLSLLRCIWRCAHEHERNSSRAEYPTGVWHRNGRDPEIGNLSITKPRRLHSGRSIKIRCSKGWTLGIKIKK